MDSATTSGSWTLTLSAILPVVAVQVLFLAPLPAVREMIATESTGQVSPFTFTAMACNGLVYFLYGYLKNDTTTMVANFPALCLGHYYLYMYRRFAVESVDKQYGFFAGICVACYVLVTAFQDNLKHVGLLGTAMSAALVGGPVTQISKVMRLRSTASLDFKFSVATFVNATLWINYGLLKHDRMIWGPSLIGFASGSLQLILFGLYR